MNYCTIQGELNDDALRDFINKANDFNQDEELTIYINSCGGTCGISGALVYFIDSYPKDVTLVGNCVIASWAFTLFMKSNSKKELANCIGVIHVSSMEVEYRDVKKNDDSFSFDVKNMNYINAGLYKLLKDIGVNKSDIKKIKNGEDVMVSQAELKRQAKVAEKLFYKSKE